MIVSFETKSIVIRDRMGEDAAEAETLLVLEDFLPYRLAVLAHRTSRELAGVYGERFGLSIPEWRILANLGRFGPLYAGDLAERSSMDKPKVTRALQRLEAGGIVQRNVDAEDRRQVRLALTRRGRSMFRAIAALALDWERQFLSPLSEAERKMLDRVLTKLLRRGEDRSRSQTARAARHVEAP
jgi:DNA-binding MarR family transcriptional regulator